MASIEDIDLLGPPDAVGRFLDHLGATRAVTLICPPGAADAPISYGEVAFVPYRQHGRRGRWLVDVPIEAAIPLTDRGGFAPVNPDDLL